MELLPLVIRYIVFVCILVLFWNNCLASGGIETTEENDPKDLGIPFCAPEVSKRQVNGLVFVSTMDGKISALNLEDGGSQKWSIETGPGPMLSSSIHNLELSNNGQWVRMIPSLSGGLYKMNGKSVEAVPINAENLLKSSFRYSDDVIISGGMESRTYGVDSATGKLLYECSMASCDNQTTQGQRATPVGDVILIQRQTQTVRAIEPRDGTERWNFSVGQHELKLSPDPSASCHDTVASYDEIVLKVIVPDGLICALDSAGTVLWKHTFEYPVVSAWRVGRSGEIKGVDLFGGTRTPEEKIYLPESPVLYVGMHNKQLYIQESVRLRNKVLESVDRLRHHLITDGHLPSIPWRPIPAKTHILGIEGSAEPILRITGGDESADLESETTAISVLYASEYVNGKGFYLYSSEEKKLLTHEGPTPFQTDEKSNSARQEVPESPFIPSNVSEYVGDDGGTFIEDDSGGAPEEDKEETPVQVIIVSFWYWWKEVMLTSIFTAIVVNLIIQRRFISILYSGRLNERNSSSLEENTSAPSNLTTTTTSGGSMASVLAPAPSADFTSRYLTDFEPIRRLGRGGFGIVFQAKNKMDDCEYAVKRIPLPNREEALERMKREVKALAKLDHQNIVRYFNSWVEEPPPGWQETADNLWLRGKENVASSDVNIDLSGAVTPTSDVSSFAAVGTAAVRKRNVFKSFWDKASSAIHQSVSVDKDLVLPRTNDDASDSYIVFENSKSKTNSNTGKPSSKNLGDSSDDEGSDGEDVDEDHETDVTDVSKSNGNTRKHRRPVTLDLGSSDSFVPTPRLRKFLYIQMQLCQRDSLKDWLVSNPVRERPKLLNMFDQIVSAVDYVHCQGLIHRDLKPSNIFFSYDGQIKVGDFGLVTTMSEDEGVPEQRSPLFQNGLLGNCHTAHVGTHLYMSPEQLAGRQYDYKVDIFSLGVILFELLTSFSTEMERAKTLSLVRQLVFPDDFERHHPDEADLLKLMLCDDPDSRLTTIGVRSRPPLRRLSSNDSTPDDSSSDWHFTLPHRTRLRPSTSE